MNKLRIILLIGVGLSLVYSLIQSLVLRMPGRYQTQAVRTFIDFIVDKASRWS